VGTGVLNAGAYREQLKKGTKIEEGKNWQGTKRTCGG
jgi:hypothetical protein